MPMDFTNGNDTFTGDETAETLDALGGADFVDGQGGNDTIIGGGGNDTLLGGDGNDSLNGGTQSDSLFGGDGEDTLNGGLASDTLNGGAGGDVLDGGDGADMVDYSGSDAGVTVSLASNGTGTASGGHAEGDQLTGFRDITGSDHDDVISSRGNKVVLNGGAGNDTITGGGNFDRLIGGTGDDVINGGGSGGSGDVAQYSGNASDYLVGLSDTGQVRIVDLRTGIENEGVDTLIGIRNLRFSDGDVLTNDLVDNTLLFGTNSSETITARNTSITLSGFAGDDDITGNALNNFIDGGAGNDTIDGGDGDDVAIFEGVRADYTFALGANGTILVTGPEGETDTLINVERAFFGADTVFAVSDLFSSTPSEGSDLITGNAENEAIDALAGNDSVSGLGGDDTLTGGIGADTLDGGDGSDTADYSGSAKRVIIDLDAGTASGGDADGDVLVDIENITGTSIADDLTGNGENNILDGGNGGDDLIGLAGNDTLIGGFGADELFGGDGDDVLNGGFQNDIIDGGDGNDTAVYSGFGGAVTVKLTVTDAQDTGAGGFDTITGIENLIGGNTSDRFTGSVGAAGDNILDGQGGNDLLFGLGGDDTLIGGEGNDKIQGGNGDDVINGGSGRDIMVGGNGADTFVFNDVGDSAVGGQRDRINDFTQGEDVIIFEDSFVSFGGSGGGELAFGGLTELLLIGTDDFSGTAGELRHFAAPNRTIIEGDIDGDGAADFQIELFTAGLTLTVDDFGTNLI